MKMEKENPVQQVVNGLSVGAWMSWCLAVVLGFVYACAAAQVHYGLPPWLNLLGELAILAFRVGAGGLVVAQFVVPVVEVVGQRLAQADLPTLALMPPE